MTSLDILIICFRRVAIYFIISGLVIYFIYKLIITLFGIEDIFKTSKKEKEYQKKLLRK